MLKVISDNKPFIFLILAFSVSFILKVVNIKVGSPFVTIDDNTTFEGGFLVWFGNVPPQRMYLESWVAGSISILTYIIKTVLNGHGMASLNINLVTNAFRDYYGAPDQYILVYRWVMLILDMITAGFVYLTAKLVLKDRWQGLAAAIVAAMYLFSYNTIWSDLVARPDTLTSFFGVIGLYFYYRSEFGDNIGCFWISAALLGCAAGMKLHGAFFAIFILIDLLRVHGIKKGVRRAIPLVMISILFFAVSAGIPIFDPLKYVKLRMLNYKDDLSLWITWGKHFITLFRGTGWLIIPLLIIAAWKATRSTFHIIDNQIKSVILLSILWLMLFTIIRALRAYWMLPALPLFYMTAVYALGNGAIGLPKKGVTVAVAIVILMAWQTFGQFRQFRKVEFNGLRQWVVENIQKNEPFYIFGYEALRLPKSTLCIRNIATGLERIENEDIRQGKSFTIRHLKNWEEQSTLKLFDMLNFKFDNGYVFYSNYTAPLNLFEGIIDLDQMQYILVQQHFFLEDKPVLLEYIKKNFNLVKKAIGAGGGGLGLNYEIYKRKSG